MGEMIKQGIIYEAVYLQKTGIWERVRLAFANIVLGGEILATEFN